MYLASTNSFLHSPLGVNRTTRWPPWRGLKSTTPHNETRSLQYTPQNTTRAPTQTPHTRPRHVAFHGPQPRASPAAGFGVATRGFGRVWRGFLQAYRGQWSPGFFLLHVCYSHVVFGGSHHMGTSKTFPQNAASIPRTHTKQPPARPSHIPATHHAHQHSPKSQNFEETVN